MKNYFENTQKKSLRRIFSQPYFVQIILSETGERVKIFHFSTRIRRQEDKLKHEKDFSVTKNATFLRFSQLSPIHDQTQLLQIYVNCEFLSFEIRILKHHRHRRRNSLEILQELCKYGFGIIWKISLCMSHGGKN